MRTARISSIAALISTLAAGPLWAICSASPTYCESLPNLKNRGAALFLGTVTRVTLDQVTFDVTEAFLNVQPGSLEVEFTSDLIVDGVPQGMRFRKGEAWLVEAYWGTYSGPDWPKSGAKPHWITSNCIRNQHADRAGDQLRDLRALAAGKLPAGRIAVQVFDDAAHRYLRGVPLTLRGPANTVSATTDDRGGFLFEDLAPGMYEVSAQLPDWPAPLTSRVDLTQTWCSQVRLLHKTAGE